MLDHVTMIDKWIDLGLSYDEAYYAGVVVGLDPDDLEPKELAAMGVHYSVNPIEVKPLQTMEQATNELVIKLAMGRGYSETEAVKFCEALRHTAKTNYSKAYEHILARLG